MGQTLARSSLGITPRRRQRARTRVGEAGGALEDEDEGSRARLVVLGEQGKEEH